MEDTLAARTKMEEARAKRRNAPGENSSVTGSLTANYSHHQKEWAMQIRELQNRQVLLGTTYSFDAAAAATIWFTRVLSSFVVIVRDVYD